MKFLIFVGGNGGDGQAGADGEGRAGTDRSNIVQMNEPGESFPTIYKNASMFKSKLGNKRLTSRTFCLCRVHKFPGLCETNILKLNRFN